MLEVKTYQFSCPIPKKTFGTQAGHKIAENFTSAIIKMFWGEHLRFLGFFKLFYLSDCFACKYFFAACVCSAPWRTEEGSGNLELGAWLQNTMSYECWELGMEP